MLSKVSGLPTTAQLVVGGTVPVPRPDSRIPTLSGLSHRLADFQDHAIYTPVGTRGKVTDGQRGTGTQEVTGRPWEQCWPPGSRLALLFPVQLHRRALAEAQDLMGSPRQQLDISP